MPVDPHTIVLYHSIFKGEEVDTLLARIPGLGDVTTNLSTRVSTIEQQLAPHIILTVQQVKYVGGMRIESPAGAECISVEELARGYKCTFDTNHGSEPLLFDVYDQVLGMRFDLGTTTQNDYWRLVTEVGDDYIILSKTDCAPGSGVPQTGDCMITVGNRFSAARQNLQISSTIGTDAPRLEQYEGINDYNLSERLITVIGMKDGKMGVYTKNGEFSGEVHITDGSGLENLDEWAEAAQDIADAASAAAAAADAAAAAQRTADQAANKLNDWASDGVISPVEKEPLRQQWIDAQKEYTSIIADAVRYRVDSSAFTAAYTLANAAFQKYTANPTQETTKESDYDNIAGYYNARATILTNIAIAAKDIVDAAQSTADDAAAAAAAAQGTADAAAAKAQHLETILNQINDDTVLDPSEKNVIRTEWITINGTPSTGHTGVTGSYYTTKKLFEQYKDLGERVKYTFNGTVFSFNGVVYTYKSIGVSALDAAYLQLREYLRSIDINNPTTFFEGFDRNRYSALLTQYYDAELTVQDNINKALQSEITKAKAEMLAALQSYESAINRTIEDMQDIIDNVTETHWGIGTPTLQNLPASEWVGDPELLERHAGDTYYDTGVADESDPDYSPTAGYAFRFERRGTEGSYTYSWEIIPDSTVAEALRLAAQAKDTADGKRRNFTSAPTDADEYDEGDVWLHATAGAYVNEMLVAIRHKDAGVAFSLADWSPATKYTDDTVANAAAAAASAAQATADGAASAAAAAQSTADAAASAAAAANTKLSNWADDGKISPVEKGALAQQREEIEADYSELFANATAYGVSTAAYTAAYNAAILALVKYTASTPEVITIESDYANIAAYYDARVIIAQAIAAAAKAVADTAQSTADAAAAAAAAAASAAAAAQGTADAAASAAAAAAAAASAAQGTADSAASAAAAANTQLSNWASDGIISPVEKTGLAQQWKDVQTEYTQILADAAQYLVNTNAYTAAYTAANAAFQKYTANPSSNTTKDSDYANIAAYYDARNTILQTIATAAKAVADAAQTAADAAQAAADKAQGEIDAINDDTVLDPSEKASMRTIWTGINGISSTSTMGETGTYALAKILLAAADKSLRRVLFTFKGKVYTFNGKKYTFSQLGETQLDAAYMMLREYLHACQINEGGSLPGFDRSVYAEKLRDYDVALTNVMGTLSELAKAAAEKVDTKLSDYEYLKRALPNDTTTDISNAMVLSTLLGVKDGDNVVAGLAGGLVNFPMIWAAAQSVQEVNKALWRVYGTGEQILGIYNGKRIRIFPDAGAASPDPRIEIYDGNDNAAPASVFSGRNYSSIADIFGSAGSASLSASGGSIGEANIDTSDPTHHTSLISLGGDTYKIEEDYATFTTQKAGKVTISGNATISGSFYTDDLCALRYCNVSVLLDGVSIASIYVSDDSVDTAWSAQATFSIGSHYLSAGTHKLTLRIEFEIPRNAGPLCGCSASVVHSSTSISIEYDAKRNELFGNGLAIGQSNLKYLWVANESGNFRFKCVSGDAGIQIYGGQLKVKIGGSWYLVGVSGGNLTATATSE